MACFMLRDSEGRERWQAAEVDYRKRLDEQIVEGMVRYDCGPQDMKLSGEVDEQLAQHGIQWGDAIAWTAKKLGLRQCAPCKARQQILNSAKELGWAETLRQLKETL